MVRIQLTEKSDSPALLPAHHLANCEMVSKGRSPMDWFWVVLVLFLEWQVHEKVKWELLSDRQPDRAQK